MQSLLNLFEGANTGVDPKTVRRDCLLDNPEVREEIKVIAAARRRFGCRRIGVLFGPIGADPAINPAGLFSVSTELIDNQTPLAT